MATAANQFRPDYAVPPGWILEERLEVHGMSQAEFARRCGRSAKLISEIIVLDWLTQRDDGDLDEDGLAFPENAKATDKRWKRAISGEGGELVEFNVDNVMKVFDDIPDLLKMVKETSEDASLFRQELLKGVEGN